MCNATAASFAVLTQRPQQSTDKCAARMHVAFGLEFSYGYEWLECGFVDIKLSNMMLSMLYDERIFVRFSQAFDFNQYNTGQHRDAR